MLNVGVTDWSREEPVSAGPADRDTQEVWGWGRDDGQEDQRWTGETFSHMK